MCKLGYTVPLSVDLSPPLYMRVGPVDCSIDSIWVESHSLAMFFGYENQRTLASSDTFGLEQRECYEVVESATAIG